MGVGEEGRERDIEKVWTYIQGVNSGYLWVVNLEVIFTLFICFSIKA